jgi:predicted peptidase
LVAAINQAGGSAKYTEYPDTGHGSWGRAYNTNELWTWLFEQRLKSTE